MRKLLKNSSSSMPSHVTRRGDSILARRCDKAFRPHPESPPGAVERKQANMSTIKRILLVEDNPADACLLREIFHKDVSLEVDLVCATSMAEAEKYLAAVGFDFILLDPWLPDAQGLVAIRRARIVAPDVPMIVLTSMDDETLSTESLQEGAQDYLIKGQFEARGLLRTLRCAAERKRLERLRDEFVSTVSHELRTPLTAIAGSLGLLMGSAAGMLPEPAARLVGIAHNSSQRLVRLVNDILDIEKLDYGHAAFDFKRVEVGALVSETVESIRGYADGRGVKVRIESATGLAQVVTNLLSNAIRFSPADSEVVVSAGKKAGSDAVVISVRDHGQGISADFKSRIFGRFAQADGTNARREGGTGLGLSIARQIVDRLGGQIGFADAVGGGTIFHVELPISDGLADVAQDGRSGDLPFTSPIPLVNIEDTAPQPQTLTSAGATGGAA
jgi:signal transduction histidine kinase